MSAITSAIAPIAPPAITDRVASSLVDDCRDVIRWSIRSSWAARSPLAGCAVGNWICSDPMTLENVVSPLVTDSSIGVSWSNT